MSNAIGFEKIRSKFEYDKELFAPRADSTINIFHCHYQLDQHFISDTNKKFNNLKFKEL